MFPCSFVIPHPATSDRKKLALRRKVLIRFRSAVLLIVNRQRHMRVRLLCNAHSKMPDGKCDFRDKKKRVTCDAAVSLSLSQTVVEPARKAEEVSAGRSAVVLRTLSPVVGKMVFVCRIASTEKW